MKFVAILSILMFVFSCSNKNEVKSNCYENLEANESEIYSIIAEHWLENSIKFDGNTIIIHKQTYSLKDNHPNISLENKPISSYEKEGVEFVSLQESVDTATSGGKLVFHVFVALAEFERELIRERTKAGLKAARDRGSKNGKPKKLTKQQISIAKKLMDDKETNILEITKTMKVSRSALYRYQTTEAVKNKD